MFRTIFMSCILGFCFFFVPVNAEKKPFTVSDFEKIVIDPKLKKTISGFEFTSGPTNDHVFVRMSKLVSGNEPSGIYLLNLKTGERTFVGRGREPTASPDGSYLAYLDVNNDVVVVQFNDALQPHGTRHIKVGEETSEAIFVPGERRMEWSPDSTQLAFVYSTSTGRKTFHGDAAYSKGSVVRLFNASTGELKTLLNNPEKTIGEVSWSPDGKWLVLTTGLLAKSGLEESGVWLQLLDTRSGEVEYLTGKIGNQPGFTHGTISPDGETVAFFYGNIRSPAGAFETSWVPGLISLSRTDSEGRQSPRLATSNDFMAQALQPPTWATNPDVFNYICKNAALFSSFCETNVDTGVTRFLNMPRTEDISAYSYTASGDQLVWSSVDIFGVYRIRAANSDGGNMRTLYEYRTVEYEDYAMGQIEEFHWAAPGGPELKGFLVYPVDYVPGDSYPLIVDGHGGPWPGVSLTGAVTLSSALEWQMWANMGYAVLVADYRWSMASGSRVEYFRRNPRKALYDPAVDDVIAAVEKVVAGGIADESKLFFIGHSAGAAIANWMITRDHPFAAVVSKEGLHDYRTRNRQEWLEAIGTDYRREFELWRMNASEEDYEYWAEKSSTITYAERITTPILFFSAGRGFGGEDAVFIQYLVDAINQHGGNAKLIHFPDATHAISNPEHKQVVLRETIDWIQQNLPH